MNKIKITVIRKARYDDLIEKYENPIEHACDLKLGQIYICNGLQKPEGFVTAPGTAFRHLFLPWLMAVKISMMVG